MSHHPCRSSQCCSVFRAIPLACIATLIILSGCVSAESGRIGPYKADHSGRYVAPIGGAPVIVNETPYSEALRCLARSTGPRRFRIAVGPIPDDTGGGGITRGAALMAMSALAKAGVPLAEWTDISFAGRERRDAASYDYYLTGGITELNPGIRWEGGADGARAYVLNIGLDLRLVDGHTLDVVDVVSYQKQIAGYREPAGISVLEPVQLAVRATIERAVLEMVSRLDRAPQSCASATGTALANSLADYADGAAPGRQAAVAPAMQEKTREARQPKLDRSYRRRESADELRLRREFD